MIVAAKIYACVVLALCFLSVHSAVDNLEDFSARTALKVLSNCSNYDEVLICFKKEALALLDKLGRVNEFSLGEKVKIVRVGNYSMPQDEITGETLDKVLPRSLDAKSAALNNMMVEKFRDIIGSSVLEINMPKESEENPEGRGDFYGGSNKRPDKRRKKKKKNRGDGIHCFLAFIAAKALAFKVIFIAGLFLLAKKALIISKIALLISGIIAVKKLVAAKLHKAGEIKHIHASGFGDHDVHHDVPSASGSGYGLIRRSIDSLHIPYSAYKPK